MSMAFFCWGGCFIFLSLALWPLLRSVGGQIGKWWLIIIGTACIGAGIFIPNQITEPLTTLSHKLHALCGVIVIFTTPMAALMVTGSLTKEGKYKPFKLSMRLFTALVWIGLIAFFASLIIYKPVGLAYNETNLIGVPNRFMVVTYTIWSIAINTILSKVIS